MDLNELKRFPDVDGPNLTAVDAADRLLLDTAAELISGTAPSQLVVIDDNYGALTLGAIGLGAHDVRVHQDLLTGERALANNAATLGGLSDYRSLPLTAGLCDDATLVLMRLPRSLDRLDEVASLVARQANSTVVLVAGGRVKHMTPAMNDVLSNHFGQLDVTHARQKSRVLLAREPVAREPDTAASQWPQTSHHPDVGLSVVAHGGVFASTRIDIGTRFLLEQLDAAVPDAASAIDLACGTGIIGVQLARTRAQLRVLATDRSASAVASARATAQANGVADRVEVVQADGLEGVAPASAELITLNPPFHSDAALATGIASHLFGDAARALAPGGELWCVWNSHLRYRAELERIVGPTRQVARNAKFTVTASRR